MNENIKTNFINPPSEFSLLPFWFWNDELNNDEIKRQINDMYEKGVRGFVIHPRIGIPENIRYMSAEFLSYVRCAVEEAARLNMRVMLYDEGMYPSGSAHGMVVKKNKNYASKGIRVLETNKSKPEILKDDEELILTLCAKKTGDMLLEPSSITEACGGEIPEDNVYLHFICGFTGGHLRGIHIGEDDWENPPKSADLLKPDAVKTFIELTHERYYDALSEFFGNTIFAIFTDEPSIMGRGGREDMKEWTDGFLDDFLKIGLKKEDLPALWYNIGEETENIRKKYAKAVENRLSTTFYKPISDWCKAHKIALAGHPGAADDIGLLSHFHIPGQDLVFRWVAPEDDKALVGTESLQAKCSSDFARHRGLRRNLNECFACGGKNKIEWSFTAEDMKWMTDWLFARGVNMLVPHAFFYSVNGERRYGERPPDVGPNNIWWKHYNLFSSYVKRMCYMLTDSFNTAEVAVLCGSKGMPYMLTKELYITQTEFNYLEASLITEGKASVLDGALTIEKQRYNVLLIEDISLITEEIRSFSAHGIKVIAYNPNGVDLGDDIISIKNYSEVTAHLKRTVEISPENGDIRVSRIVKENETFYLIFNEGENKFSGELYLSADDEIYTMNALTGEVKPCMGKLPALNRRESIIIAAGKNTSTKTTLCFCDEEEKCKQTAVKWKLNGKNVVPKSWTEICGMEDFCGTAVYEAEVEILGDNIKKAVLDLKSVGEQAEVLVNGKMSGVRLWMPYEFDITENLKSGKNKLCVYVTNSLANRYTEHRLPSGLLEESVLKIYEK